MGPTRPQSKFEKIFQPIQKKSNIEKIRKKIPNDTKKKSNIVTISLKLMKNKLLALEKELTYF